MSWCCTTSSTKCWCPYALVPFCAPRSSNENERKAATRVMGLLQRDELVAEMFDRVGIKIHPQFRKGGGRG